MRVTSWRRQAREVTYTMSNGVRNVEVLLQNCKVGKGEEDKGGAATPHGKT